MRPTSTFVASLLGLSLLVCVAQAAPAAKPSKDFVEPVKAALAKMTLTDEQKTKIDAAVAEAKKELDTMTADAKAAGKKKDRTAEDKKAAQAKRQEFAKKFRSDVEAVLTPEQKKELQAALKASRKGAKEAKPADAPAAEGAN